MPEQVARRRPYAARVPIEERREQLLDAALAIIDREGYDKISIDAIAREAGVTRPVVYGAFDDLGALLGSLLDRQQVRALEQLYAALPLDTANDIEELLSAAVPALHRMVLADPMTWRAILTSGTAAPAVMQQRIDGDRERVRQTIGSFIADWTGKDLDTDVFAHAVLAVLEHFGRLILADPETYSADRLRRALVSLVRAEFGQH